MKLKHLIIFLFIINSTFGTFAEDTLKSISVKEAEVRNRPSFLGKVLYTLEYGSSVSIQESRGGWSKILSSYYSEMGWIHASALSESKLVLNRNSSGIDSGVSNSEVALAGKGFNKEVEANYISENNIDFSLIDQMEQFVITDEDLILFIEEGNLTLGGLE